jgi:hypothetical protein
MENTELKSQGQISKAIYIITYTMPMNIRFQHILAWYIHKTYILNTIKCFELALVKLLPNSKDMTLRFGNAISVLFSDEIGPKWVH